MKPTKDVISQVCVYGVSSHLQRAFIVHTMCSCFRPLRVLYQKGYPTLKPPADLQAQAVGMQTQNYMKPLSLETNKW